jgi:N-acetylglutamate synthase-like GNAT family acetyltransferase
MINMEIRTPQNQQEWDAYYDLRYRILRAPWNQPLGSERNEQDAIAIHLACFENNKILGVARLDTESDDFAQVRFMAVDNSAQGKGIGKKIMLAAEQNARMLGYSKLMLQARENAILFYISLGYEKLDKTHLLFGEIQHWRMEKGI